MQIERVQASLPEELRVAALEVTVVIQILPGPEHLDDEDREDELLGLFTGGTHVDMVTGCDVLPPQIFLFLANIWDYSGREPRVFSEELRKTYLHELGHFLGLGEDDLDARGMG